MKDDVGQDFPDSLYKCSLFTKSMTASNFRVLNHIELEKFALWVLTLLIEFSLVIFLKDTPYWDNVTIQRD